MTVHGWEAHMGVSYEVDDKHVMCDEFVIA